MGYQQKFFTRKPRKIASIFRSVAILKFLKFVITFENPKCVKTAMFLPQTVHLILP